MGRRASRRPHRLRQEASSLSFCINAPSGGWRWRRDLARLVPLRGVGWPPFVFRPRQCQGLPACVAGRAGATDVAVSFGVAHVGCPPAKDRASAAVRDERVTATVQAIGDMAVMCVARDRATRVMSRQRVASADAHSQ
jgi:hypothetical protein